MKTIILTGINARYSHSNLALLYLKKSIEDICYDTRIVEFTIGKSSDKMAVALKQLNPLVVAISVYIWNSIKVRELLKYLQDTLPNLIIVLGGPEVSYNPDKWLNDLPERGYIICGPGEVAFRELALQDFNVADKIIRTPDVDFNKIGFPYNKLQMERLDGRIIYYESTRGCFYKCSYCLSSRIDQKFQFRSFEKVKDELDFICSFQPRFVKFVDRTFNSRKSHYKEIWNHLVSNYAVWGTVFHFEIFPEFLDDDDLLFLKDVPTGLFQFEIGIQSVNPDTLDAVHRKYNFSKSFYNIKKLVEQGNIHLHVDLIVGLPFEDYNSLKKSFDDIYKLGTEHFQVGFLKVLPGTEIKEKFSDYGIVYSSTPPYEIISNFWLTVQEMNVIRKIAEINELFRNKGKFRTTVKFVAEIYESPFMFYEKLSVLFNPTGDALHRHWTSLSQIIMEVILCEFPDKKDFLLDCLRWDWCSSMKAHHYPEFLKSNLTLKAKRRGYNFLIKKSVKNVIEYKENVITREDLRNGIFFMAGTDIFREKMMEGEEALFLPDGRLLFFDIF